MNDGCLLDNAELFNEYLILSDTQPTCDNITHLHFQKEIL